MIPNISIELERRESELRVIQELKLNGMFNPMRTATECRRVVGAEWFRDAVAKKKITGVRQGKRVKYHLEKLLSCQILELRQAERQVEIAKS